MKGRGIVLSGPDKTIQAKANAAGLPVIIDAGMPLAFGKTLFVAPGTQVPWDLLPAGWHFLERWDAAVPLWRYGVTAADVGSPAERKQTRAVVRDLRVLLHSVELLFVRNNRDGQALMAAYRAERAIGDPRLAFLRAFYRVKPRLCVLPVTWLADVRQRSNQNARSGAVAPPRRAGRLVRIEVSPGRWVKCHEGDEETVRAQYAERLKPRNEW